jgi:hypothetical protein
LQVALVSQSHQGLGNFPTLSFFTSLQLHLSPSLRDFSLFSVHIIQFNSHLVQSNIISLF